MSRKPKKNKPRIVLKNAVRCDKCGCAFVPETLTQREGEIEYSIFRCDYCGKAYLVSVTDTQLGKTAAVSALKQQMQIAGIKPSTPGAKTGIHSLRHSLARKLLDKNVPLEDIADIMGHTEVVSSSPYLKIDVEGLRGCALSLKEVAEYV